MAISKQPSLAQKTTIAYFDPLNVYGDIKQELLKHVPLTNLHWNHPLRPLRTINTLDVEFVEESAQAMAAPKHEMLGLSSTPCYKIIFIKCDDTDTYRSTVRPIIKEWIANSVTGVRDPVEWIIFHYVPPGSKAFLGNRFKYGVFDKIKADFNTESKKDRCVQIKHEYSSNAEKDEAWRNFSNRMKEGVLEAFSDRVDLYQDEINKLEAKKHILGWNFGKFFVLKEGLALAFERMSLFEDALLLYDELEEAFIQLNRQKSVTSFSAETLKTLSHPLLVVQKMSEIRHDILTNDISLFDFQCYLFSRQVYLLLCIAENSNSHSISALKIGELFLRLRSFLTEMNGMLNSFKQSVQSIAEWTFSVAQEFQQASKYVDGGLVREVAEGRGELYLLIRKSIETIAATHNWNIEGVLTEVSLDDKTTEVVDPDYHIQNDVLASYLESDKSFYSTYKSITEFALAEFDLADRVRTKNRLSAQLALLDYQLGNYAEAAKSLESIPGLYGRQGWNLISSSLLLVYVQCLKKLDRKEAILANSLELLSRSDYLTPAEIGEHIKYVQELSDTVSFSATLDNFFECSIDPHVTSVTGKDEYCMEVTLTNPLKQDFKFDTGTITMRNIKDTTDILTFDMSSENGIVAKGGINKFHFKTKKFVRANFKVTGMFLTKGKLTLTKNFSEASPIIIQLYPAPYNFHAKFCVPPTVDLNERRLGLHISSGQNQISKCKITFKSVTVGLKLMSLKAQNEPDINKDLVVETHEGRPPVITFEDLEPNSIAVLTVPYMFEYDLPHVRLKAFIQYTTQDNETFSNVIDQNIDIALALSVNVQDFYKLDKLFSKFTMSCNSAEPVCILETNLLGNEDFTISSPFGTSIKNISYPEGPVSYGFCIQTTENRTGNDIVELITKHRYLKDECVLLVWKLLNSILDKSPYENYGLIIESLLYGVNFDSVGYSHSGIVTLPENLLETMKSSDLLQHIPADIKKEMFEYLKENLPVDTDNIELTEKDLLPITRKLIIPVSIPRVHMVHTVELHLPAEDHFVVGKAIPVTVDIRSCDAWAPLDADNTPKTFLYDITAPPDLWAVSGKKRAQFIHSSNDGCITTTSIKLSLIPLKTGKLCLPKINIQKHQSVAEDVIIETDYKNLYQSALVVPEFGRLTLSF